MTALLRESIALVADFDTRPPGFAETFGNVVRCFFEQCRPPHGYLTATYPYWDPEGNVAKTPELDTDKWKSSANGGRLAMRRRLGVTTREELKELTRMPDEWDSLMLSSVPTNARDRVLDENYTFEVTDNVQFCEGLALRVRIHINVKSVMRSPNGAGEWVRQTIQLLGRHEECYHAFVDVCPTEEIAAGLIYDGIRTEPLHRIFNQRVYDAQGVARKNYVRGVYWGNYLGPHLMQRFDPHKLLTVAFEELAKDRRVQPVASNPDEQNVPATHYVMRTPRGGCLFALSESPLTWTSLRDGHPEFGESWEMAIWLHQRLRERQLLI